MSDLAQFFFENKEIRATLDSNNDPLFVVKDVLLALEYDLQGGASKYIGHVPDEWKGVDRISTPGGDQQVSVFTEQGMYFFVARSDKPKALKFQKWLAGDVVPAIRKTGKYEIQSQEPVSLAQQALMTAQVLVEFERRQKKIEEQQQIINQAAKGMLGQIREVKQQTEEVKQQTQQLEQSVEAKIDYKINHSLDYDKNLNATEVGIYLQGVSAQEVNRCAAYLGWINPILKNENDARRGIIGWILQPEGQPYAAQRLDDKGQPLTSVMYNKTAADLIGQLRKSKPSSAWCQQQIIKRYRES